MSEPILNPDYVPRKTMIFVSVVLSVSILAGVLIEPARVVAGMLGFLSFSILAIGSVGRLRQSFFTPERARSRIGLVAVSGLALAAGLWWIARADTSHHEPVDTVAGNLAILIAVPSVYFALAWISLAMSDGEKHDLSNSQGIEGRLAWVVSMLGRFLGATGELAGKLISVAATFTFGLLALVLLIWLVKTIWLAV